MFKCSLDKINELFANIAETARLCLPADKKDVPMFRCDELKELPGEY